MAGKLDFYITTSGCISLLNTKQVSIFDYTPEV